MPGNRVASGWMLGAALVLAACSNTGDGLTPTPSTVDEILDREIYGDQGPPPSFLSDLFRNQSDIETVGAVNKYIWNASLEVLNFLPLETVDPFTGVISTGFGRPPGGGRAYAATILIDDPALDARSLKLSLRTQAGPASPDTVRAVEDAILTRARQLRQEDDRL